MKSINLIGKKVVLAQSGKNLLVHGIPDAGRVVVPRGLGLEEGTTLTGEASIDEVEYPNNADGTPRLAADGKTPEPLKRWEMVSFVSLKDRKEFNEMNNAINMEDAFNKAKIAAIPKIVFTAADFSGKLVTAEQAGA